MVRAMSLQQVRSQLATARSQVQQQRQAVEGLQLRQLDPTEQRAQTRQQALKREQETKRLEQFKEQKLRELKPFETKVEKAKSFFERSLKRQIERRQEAKVEAKRLEILGISPQQRFEREIEKFVEKGLRPIFEPAPFGAETGTGKLKGFEDLIGKQSISIEEASKRFGLRGLEPTALTFDEFGVGAKPPFLDKGKVGLDLLSLSDKKKFPTEVIQVTREDISPEEVFEFRTPEEKLKETAELIFKGVGLPSEIALRKKTEEQKVLAKIGEQEFFEGKPTTELLPFQVKGTAVVSDIKFKSDEELIKDLPLGALDELIDRGQSKVDFESTQVINTNIEKHQRFHEDVLNNKLSIIVNDVQGRINGGEITLNEGLVELESRGQIVTNDVQKAFEKKVLSDSEDELGKVSKDAQDLLNLQAKKVTTQIAIASVGLNVATGLGLSLVGAIPVVGSLVGGTILGASIIKKNEIIKFARENPTAFGIQLGSFALGGLVGTEGLRTLRGQPTLTGKTFRFSKKNINKVILNINKNIDDVIAGKRSKLFSAQAVQILQEFYKKKKKKTSKDALGELTEVLEDLKTQAEGGDTIALQKMRNLLRELGINFKKELLKLPKDKQSLVLVDFLKWVQFLKQKGVLFDIVEIGKQKGGRVSRMGLSSFLRNQQRIATSQAKNQARVNQAKLPISERFRLGQQRLSQNRFEVRELSRQKLTQRQVLLLSQNIKLTQRQILLLKNRQKVVQSSVQKQDLASALVQKLKQLQKQKSLLKSLTLQSMKFVQVLKLQQRTIGGSPRLRRFRRPIKKKIKEKFRFFIKPPLTVLRKKKIRKRLPTQQPFSVFVRRRGKDINIGKKKTFQKANKFLKKRLDVSLRASGFILDKNKKKIKPKVSKGFRLSKIRPNVLVEIRSKRLSTSSEIEAIQKARKNKPPKLKSTSIFKRKK